jgi:Protein of unknown function (DUF3570)
VPLAAVLVLLAPRTAARAEDYVDTRYEVYSEEAGRVTVRTTGFNAGEEIGTTMQVGVTLLNDAIAGASPTGARPEAGSNQVPLATLSDHRKAWEADFSRQFSRINVALGTSQSREHDYVSRGWSLNTTTDFNEKNTGLLLGIAGHNDQVETFFDPQHRYFEKQAFSAIVGVRQLLDPLTVVSLNFTWARETGYLDDQYKVVEKTVELVPGSFFPLVFAENRPGERNMGTLLATLNRAFPAAHGALEASDRFFADTFGVKSDTVELRWIQNIGERMTLAPELRVDRQDSAHFYYYDLDATSIEPTTVPNPSGVAYSSDYRLSSFDAVSVGLKTTVKVVGDFILEAGYERYAMRGRDGVTPQSAYPVANIFSVGAKYSW